MGINTPGEDPHLHRGDDSTAGQATKTPSRHVTDEGLQWGQSFPELKVYPESSRGLESIGRYNLICEIFGHKCDDVCLEPHFLLIPSLNNR